jgi:hypothetical protein
MARARIGAALISLATALPLLAGCHTPAPSYRNAATSRDNDQSREDERQREQASAMNDMIRAQQRIQSTAH